MSLSLDELRHQIDEVDSQLLQLLNQRMGYVRQVGELKRQSNTIIYRPEREKAIIDRLSATNQGLLSRAAIEAIFLEIFAISRNFELPERVAYLGPEGSFTHQAAESRFGAVSEYMPLGDIRAVFEAVQTNRARFGIIPIENNQEGLVPETMDQLAAMQDLKIAAEIPMPIHFAFASVNDRLHEIKKIYSKDIAFGQCRRFLDATFREQKPELVPVDSTSRAAKLALNDPHAAAICSHIAARLYDLPMLFDNIEDSTDNFTRFLVVARDFKSQPSGNDKTSLLARLPHSDEPGSLVTFLQDFHRAGINLTKIESRPAKSGRNFQYMFFVDLDGHIDDARIKPVIEQHADVLQWLGSYVKLC
ncbi:chorismate mutase [Catalinimonas alkaloidigena]|uniref:Bifunctional chorismate mutase/prephenate dehydratase n=1 Tax=Catalinimonas alkaloidigena TaxID=1075417 RepID=A0A1G9AER2_9BACT|nr:prephenate dehydratase [Catalinimonas alkaloidigena]SDK25020.1 chorismate mutase [Catalinimonas alkaloidigena]